MRRNSAGFTLVELNLAMIFVAILVIGVAAVTITVTKINQHGIALKTVNQTGREIMDQLRRDISEANPSQIQYVAPVGGVGRLCLGSVSYVFNTAQALNTGGTLVRDTTKAGSPSVTLVRMNDRDGVWCAETSGVFTRNDVIAADEATELLQRDTLPLAIHSMDVQTIAQTNSTQANYGLISLAVMLGTNELDTTQPDGQCKPPTDNQANFDNCAVREFRTVVRNSGVN